jgi:eukaryotic-like serine/threonine-protein kinase
MYERLTRVARRLIVEAHRRSLWQVLGVYLVTAWVILQVVGELTRTAGLPLWVPPFALVLLLVGLPIVMATAIVQEGGPGSSPSGAPPDPARSTGPISAEAPSPPPTPAAPFLTRQLTWNRALAGGAAAFGLLGLLVAAYLLSWKLGVGPVGSLVAKGALEEGERIVLADFGAAVDESGLGAVITDALRIDLLETPIVRVLEPPAVRAILARMQVPADAPLDFALAREAALREGVKAVLEGSVARAGSGYVLTATLRAAETGESLAAFRETARGPDDLIPAIDRLSRRIRERAGESLRSIRAGPGLEQVTTSSLDALRLYGAAGRAFAEGGDYRRTVALLEEALALDPEFAMAWRALAVALGNAETDRVREMEASVRAYELRHRLTERERQLATADYHRRVTGDRAATIAAYRRVLEMDPQDRVALNNLSSQYSMADDREAAVELLRRAIAVPDPTPVAFINLVENLLVLGWLEEAKETAEAFARHFPDSPDVGASMFWVHFFLGDLDGARSLVEAQLESPDLPPSPAAAATTTWPGSP